MPLPTPTWVGTTALVEQKGSPLTVWADKITRTRTFRGPWAVCQAAGVPRGTMGTGEDAGFLVARCQVQPQERGIGLLTLEFEAGGEGSAAPLPADTFACRAFELNTKVHRHPAFAAVTPGELADVLIAATGGTDIARDEAYDRIMTEGSDEAVVLVDLLRKGVETWYQVGMEYVWVTRSYTLPGATLGGFRQAPSGAGAVALPSGMSWLRKSDNLEWNGSHWELTRTWLGGPDGMWDEVLYP